MPPLGALAIGCFSVVFGLTAQRLWTTEETQTVPRTGALLSTTGEFVARLRSEHSGFCVTSDVFNATNGGQLVQQNCSVNSLQRITFERLPDGDDRYRMRRSFDGKCVEAISDPALGTRVQHWTCHQGDTARPSIEDTAQLWTIESVSVSSYRIRSVSTGDLLVIQGGSYTAAAPLTLRAESGSTDEIWVFDQRVNVDADVAQKGQ